MMSLIFSRRAVVVGADVVLGLEQRPAMACPMRPSPMNPTFMLIPPIATGLSLRHPEAAARSTAL